MIERQYLFRINILNKAKHLAIRNKSEKLFSVARVDKIISFGEKHRTVGEKLIPSHALRAAAVFNLLVRSDQIADNVAISVILAMNQGYGIGIYDE